MSVPLTAVAQLENVRRQAPRTRVAGDVVPIPTEKNLTALQWQFLKSQIPLLGRGMDQRQILQSIGNVKRQLDEGR
jgi:hypothetical protein